MVSWLRLHTFRIITCIMEANLAAATWQPAKVRRSSSQARFPRSIPTILETKSYVRTARIGAVGLETLSLV